MVKWNKKVLSQYYFLQTFASDDLKIISNAYGLCVCVLVLNSFASTLKIPNINSFSTYVIWVFGVCSSMLLSLWCGFFFPQDSVSPSSPGFPSVSIFKPLNLLHAHFHPYFSFYLVTGVYINVTTFSKNIWNKINVVPIVK